VGHLKLRLDLKTLILIATVIVFGIFFTNQASSSEEYFSTEEMKLLEQINKVCDKFSSPITLFPIGFSDRSFRSAREISHLSDY